MSADLTKDELLAWLDERERTFRKPHDWGFDCLDGGWRGYQGRCWDCDWRGPERLRGDEEMGTPEGRQHKIQARRDAMKHAQEAEPLDTEASRAYRTVAEVIREQLEPAST